VVLVSGYPPTTAMGGGIILRRLLVGLEPHLVIACSGAVYDDVGADGGGGLLDCEHRLFRPWGAPRLARRVVRVLNFLRTPVMTMRLLPSIRGSTVLLVPWAGSLGAELFLAGWIAAAATRSRLVVYELDDWDASLDNHQAKLVQVLGHAAHGRILRRAAAVLAISPPEAQALHERHRVRAEVLASALEPSTVDNAARSVGETPTIVFIGAIYGAQADAIARLLRCLELLPYRVEAKLYTSATAAELDAFSINGPHLRIEAPVAIEQVLDVLRRGSALFLPASFLPDQRQLVSTSLPTKTAEYLWSGVPVLVHGPPDSVVARLATEEGWGLVADSDDERALATAVKRVLEDDDLRIAVTARARRTAADRHDLGRARTRIRAILQVDDGTG